MVALRVEPTDLTPRIIFDPDTSIFEISGFSRPENVMEFFRPVLHWLREFGEELMDQNTSYRKSQIVVNLRMTYFNSASSKFFLDVLHQFIGIHNRGNHVTINWYYQADDDEILESGEELSDMLSYPFNFIPYE